MTRELDIAKVMRVGFVGTDGDPWWYDGSPHHDASLFDGPVPVEVAKQLLGFPVWLAPVYVPVSDDPARDGEYHRVPGRIAVTAQDNGQVFYFGTEGTDKGYALHQYDEWLIDRVQMMSDAHLDIGSVGLFQNRSRAFAQFRRDQVTHEASGEKFVPFIGAYTSYDGSLSTSYRQGVTRAVCDNTFDAFRMESGKTLRVKHTVGAELDVMSAKGALDLISTATEDYIGEIEALTAREVSKRQWGQFVEAFVPIAEDAKKVAVTRGEKKRSELTQLYTNDRRVSPWAGTAWGVLQAVSTWDQHMRQHASDHRHERNITSFIQGTTAKNDAKTLDVLDRVLTAA